jgi:hypothetical protein|tara:strand:+ start:907 stop:1650 length:744 start_codon:yes stop_codon:yes gene_type:complete
MKAVQVMATYLGQRRHFPKNKQDGFDLIKKQVLHHKSLDLGVECDLLIVNHDNGDKETQDFLNQYDGENIFNGEIKILHRPRINFDLSFGSYKYAFFKYQNHYDYWYFNEDDVIILYDNAIKDMIDTLESDSTTGFVAASNFTHNSHAFILDSDGHIVSTGGMSPHAHGGCGLTSTTIFNEVCKTHPHFMQTPNILGITSPNTKGYEYASDSQMEIEFTNIFTTLGYKIKVYSDGKKYLRLQSGEYI